ncbi:MAG: protein kinase, partial [Blastocatellia bacterium]|nr:protein kinase [Blastocatellia bacterium]
MRECAICGRCYEDSVKMCTEHGDTLSESYPGPLLLAGKYKIESVIGRGGIGKVYLAEHIDLGRKVAVKRLDAKYFTDPVILERFRREARALAKVKHSGIITVHDFEIRPEGLAYIVMEHIEGRSLREELRKQQPMPITRAINVMIGICTALDFAHKEGIIHRDLKPENIMIEVDRLGSEAIKVLDFGLAELKQNTFNQVPTKITEAGVMIGTPYYVSPEQCRCEELDQRTDIYSLGVIFYEMLTGRVPFTANHVSLILLQHATEQPALPSEYRPELNDAVVAFVMKALEKDRNRRFQSSEEMIQELKLCLQNPERSLSGSVQSTRHWLSGSAVDSPMRLSGTRSGLRSTGGVYDPLTGAYTNTYFVHKVKQQLETTAERRPCVVVAIDIDNFKLLNEQYGYLAGDQMLKALVSWFYKELPSETLVGRGSGDEFNILLSGLDRNAGTGVVAKILELLRSKTFFIEQMEGGVNFKLSMGIAAFPEDASNSFDLINRALEAMQAAKELGGNQAVRADGIRTTGTLRLKLNFDIFIGRQAELAELNTCLDATVAGQSYPILIIGEQGFGKSSLLKEFSKQLLGKDVLYLSGSFYQVGQEATYKVFYDTLRSAIVGLDTESDTDLKAVFGTLAERVRKDFIENEDMDLVLSGELQTEHTRYRFFEYILRLYLSLTQICPLVLALDDIQWADQFSLDLITHLIRDGSATRFMFVGTIREEELFLENGQLRTWLRSFSNTRLEQVKLLKLSDAELLEILHSIFSRVKVSDVMLRRLCLESDGNPNSIIEIVRLLVEEGCINWNGIQWVLQELHEIRLPQTLLEQSEQQFMNLDERLVEVLMQASVIGQEFHFDRLLTIAGKDEDELLELTEEAIKRHFIEEVARRGGEIYRFRSNLIRKCLYNKLNKRRRRKIHQEVAVMIEKSQLKSANILAYHYFHGEDYIKAFDYSLKAAERAVSDFSLFDAAVYYGWAEESLAKVSGEAEWLQQSDKDQKIASFRKGYGSLLYRTARYEEAEEQFRDMFRNVASVLSVEERLLVTKMYGESLLRADRADEAMEKFEQACIIAHELGDLESEAEVLYELGQIHMAKGQKDAALSAFRQLTDSEH